MCASEFPGAHLCYGSEYLRANSSAPVPAGGAWIDLSSDINGSGYSGSSSPLYGRYTGTACTNWTTSSGSFTGYVVGTDGGLTGVACNQTHPLACCDGTPRTIFAGVTSTNATMSGRPQMHALCEANYPGSHMCYGSEYLRAASSVPIPAGGAWIDLSADLNGSGYSGSSSPVYGRYTGTACVNGTSTSGSFTGYVVGTDGALAGVACNQVHPVACCL
jgi:hypothetical protein